MMKGKKILLACLAGIVLTSNGLALENIPMEQELFAEELENRVSDSLQSIDNMDIEQGTISIDLENIEPKAPTYDLVRYELVQIKGKGSLTPNGPKRDLYEPFDRNMQQHSDYADFTTKYYYDRSQPITVTFYQDGYGNGTGFPAPTAEYRIDSERRPYDYTLDSYGGVKTFKFDEVITNIDTSISELNLSSTAWSRGVNRRKWVRKLTINLMDDRSQAPETVKVTVNPNNTEEYLLVGIDDTMEYRSRTESGREWSDWTPCTGNEMSIPVPTSDMLYQVRYRATDTEKESQCVTLNVGEGGTAPAVSIDWKDESFKGLEVGMEMAIEGQPYVTVTDEMIQQGVAPFVDQITGSDPVVLKIRQAATETSIPSKAKEIKLYAREPQPTGIMLDSNTYIVSGVSSSMQYMGPDDKTWRSISTKTVNLSEYASGSQEVAVKFRTKNTSTTSPSKPVIVTLPTLAPAPSTLKVDYMNECVTGFDSNVKYQYRLGTGSWQSVSLKNGSFSISSLISTSSDKVLSIRTAPATGSQMSDAWTVTLPAKPKTPTDCKFIYNDVDNIGKAVFVGTSSDWEYQISGDKTWTPCISNQMIFELPEDNKTFYVRVKATDTAFASNKKTLTLYAPGTAPSASLSTSKETISVNNKMEYKIDDGEYISVSDEMKSMPMSDYIDSISGEDSLQFTFRYKNTETRPSSKEKVVTIIPRREAPSTVVYDKDTQMISGTTSSMQYREKGTETWKTASSKPFSVETIIGDRTEVELEFRYSYTTKLVASKIVTVKCYK